MLNGHILPPIFALCEESLRQKYQAGLYDKHFFSANSVLSSAKCQRLLEEQGQRSREEVLLISSPLDPTVLGKEVMY